jgi:3-hydroxyacyl-[acyl-carrier-protein] dehydratase
VVLAKLAKAKFTGRARPGHTLEYRVTKDWIRGDGAQVSGTVYDGERVHGEVQLMYARMGDEMAQKFGKRLFSPRDLRHWLQLVGVFEVGVKPDGTRMRAADYPLDDAAVAAAGG